MKRTFKKLTALLMALMIMLVCFGCSADDNGADEANTEVVSDVNTSVQLNFANGNTVVAGICVTLGIKNDGTVVAVGDNEYGQCNVSGLTDVVDYEIESYFGRDIKVIFADNFAETTAEKLKGTALENVPLIGTLSQFGGLSSFADEKEFYPQIMRLYGE